MTILHFYHDLRSAKVYIQPFVKNKISGNKSILVIYTNKIIKKNLPDVIFINTFRSLNIIKICISLISTLKLIFKKKPKIIIAHSFISSFFPLFISFICLVPNRVYFNHGIPYIGYKGSLRYILKFIEKINIFLCTEVICVGPTQKTIFKNLTNKNVTNFYPASACGISNKWFKKINLSKINKIQDNLSLFDKFIVLYVGRPKIRKGYLDAINSIIKCKDDNIILLLLGIEISDIPNYSKYKNIIPLGYKKDTIPYYDIADIVFLPSHHEGFGYSLLEGAARGCALITSDIPGPDAICTSKNGFKVNVQDLDNFSDKIKFLKNNRIVLKKMQSNSLSYARKFRRKEILNQYKNFIENKLLDH